MCLWSSLFLIFTVLDITKHRHCQLTRNKSKNSLYLAKISHFSIQNYKISNTNQVWKMFEFKYWVIWVLVLLIFEKLDSQIVRVFSNIPSISNCDRVLADAYSTFAYYFWFEHKLTEQSVQKHIAPFKCDPKTHHTFNKLIQMYLGWTIPLHI